MADPRCRNVHVKKIIAHSPVLFGILVALVLFSVIMTIVIWFPRIDGYLGENKRLVQAFWFSAVSFVVWLSRLWKWRRRGAFVFWLSVCFLLLLHVFGIFMYTIHFGPLLVWQWVPLIVVESVVVVFIVGWSTRRFGNVHRHENR